jgi:hypothetical protein
MLAKGQIQHHYFTVEFILYNASDLKQNLVPSPLQPYLESHFAPGWKSTEFQAAKYESIKTCVSQVPL